MIFQGGSYILPLDPRMHMIDSLAISKFSNLEDRFSHATVHFSSDDSKHDEVHDSAIFYLVLH